MNIPQGKDHNTILHILLEKEGTQVQQHTASLIKDLLERYPTHQELENELSKIQETLQVEEKKLEDAELAITVLQKINENIPIPEDVSVQKIASEQIIERLTQTKKWIEEKVIYEIVHEHYNEMKELHIQSQSKTELEQIHETNAQRIIAIEKTLLEHKTAIGVCDKAIEVLTTHKDTIAERVTMDNIETSLTLSINKNYENLIYEQNKKIQNHTQESQQLTGEHSSLVQQNQEIEQKLEEITTEGYDSDTYTNLEKFLGKDKEQLYVAYKERITPAIEQKIQQARFQETITQLTNEGDQLKANSDNIYWFNNLAQELQRNHPDIPQEAITAIVIDFIKKSITPSLLCALTNKDIHTVSNEQEIIKKHKEERKKLDEFSIQFRERHDWYTAEGKEKIQYALGYSTEEQKITLYVPNENDRNQEREISFSTIDRAIEHFFRDIQDCLSSGYTYDEKRGHYFSSNYTEKLKLLNEVKESINDTSDHTDDAPKIKEFIKKVIKAKGSTDYAYAFHKDDQKPITTLTSKERLDEIEQKTEEFTAESSTLVENYYTQRSAINRRMYRTDKSNSSYPLPENIPNYFSIIRNTDTYGNDAPDKQLQSSYKSVHTYTKDTQNLTQDNKRHDSDSDLLTNVKEKLKAPPKKNVVFIDSEKLLKAINDIPGATEALERNGISLPNTLDGKNIPQIIQSILSKITNLQNSKEQNEKKIKDYTKRRQQAITTLNNTSLYIQHYTNGIDAYIEKCKKAELGSNSTIGLADDKFPLYLKHKAQIEADKITIEEQISGFFSKNTFSTENCEICQSDFNKLSISTGTGIAAYWEELKKDSSQATIDQTTCLKQRKTTQTEGKELGELLKKATTK